MIFDVSLEKIDGQIDLMVDSIKYVRINLKTLKLIHEEKIVNDQTFRWIDRYSVRQVDRLEFLLS